MIFEISNLVYQYTEGAAPVLNVPSLSVAEQEKVYIFGPSGAGKTTFLEVLAGVLPISHGEIRFLGQPWSTLSGTQRDRLRADHMGYLFQSFNLIPYLSVLENIVLPLHLSRRRRRERCEFTDEVKEARRLAGPLGIEEFLPRRVTQLSVGQQQRVAAARALIGSPEVLLADEPTSALDQENREIFLELLFAEVAKQKTTLLFVSHDRSLQTLFDRSLDLRSLQKETP